MALERQIRDTTAASPRNRPPGPRRPLPVRTLSESLGDAALLEFVHLDGTLHAVTVAGGRIRLLAARPGGTGR